VFLNKHDATVYGLREPMPIQIVCGDCSEQADESGEIELLPVRTVLGPDGRCYTCGGRSYVIASELCGQLARTITERRRSAETQSARSSRREDFSKNRDAGQCESEPQLATLLQVNLGVS
jgi:hypothetical protein